jgi:hypothetical protein
MTRALPSNRRVPFAAGISFAIAILGNCLALTSAPADELQPFGAGRPAPDLRVSKPGAPSLDIGAFAADNKGQWTVEVPPAGKEGAFAVETIDGREALRIRADALTPAKSTVRILLPGDGAKNGDVWAKSRADSITFLCRSNKPAALTFHLLHRGKSAGTYNAKFSVAPGDWQKVTLPLEAFGLKAFDKTAGVGIRVASAEPGTEVWIADLGVAAPLYTNDSWRTQRVSTSLKGDWKFSIDAANQGVEKGWQAKDFDDSAWRSVATGKSWQEQGVPEAGWGWYRQRIFVPKEAEGQAMVLKLMDTQSDDDVWVNGTRVGGWHGEYKYLNQLQRIYTVPPSVLRYGEPNTVAVRVWGGNLSFIGAKSGMVNGNFVAEFDPYTVMIREADGKETPASLYDFSDAQRGKPFSLVFRFPAEIAKPGAKFHCQLTDFYQKPLGDFTVPLETKEKSVEAVIPVDAALAQKIYLRGRFKAALTIADPQGARLYAGVREFDRLSFARRDDEALPPLAEKREETPYGNLKLIDEIDCSTPLAEEIHPYLQSGFEKNQAKSTPGSDVDVKVSEILGKKARESEYGWFAYRIGRGKLKPRSTYLLRIEYPEDKPRYAPIEIQTGQNFADVGWENGIGPADPYAPWPLSKKWQWYDVIVPLDDETVGAGGTGTASAENGFWVYLMNKIKPNSYFSMYDGGPAVARMKLYEISAEEDSPKIALPEGLPQRLMMFDWERQPDHEPADLVRYAKLMGYNAISPVIMKWHTMYFGEPLDGFDSVNVDAQDYWTRSRDVAGDGQTAAPAVPGKPTIHQKYLEATKKFGVGYVPRFEFGGSNELPVEARAIGGDGEPAKPNRFHQWCSNLLNPATFTDLKRLMDNLIKPYVETNPQLLGALWRIRCDRMPISYGRADLEMFAKETGVKLPEGSDKEVAAWASAGEGRVAYDDWWLKKRAAFHKEVVDLFQTYRPGLRLYYYNWDPDKFSIGLNSLTTWAFLINVANAKDKGRAVYEQDRVDRAKLTGKDYVELMRTGNFAVGGKGFHRADYAMRPELYKDIKNMEIFAPANQRFYADDPIYMNYFETAEGVASSNVLLYDEVAARSINPKYEGNMITPAGAPFSMAYELMAYFQADARTLSYTVYTYGRGFADAHRRFAQAFLALPAIPGQVVEQDDKEVKLREYPSPNGTYIGVAYKGMENRKLTLAVSAAKSGAQLKNLVTGETVPMRNEGDKNVFEIESDPMSLHAFLLK